MSRGFVWIFRFSAAQMKEWLVQVNTTVATDAFSASKTVHWLDIADSLLAMNWLVVRAVAGVLTLQEHVYLAERRSLGRLGTPTLEHQVVDLPRTGARLL